MKERNKACRWVRFNQDLIALRFLSCLEPGEEAWEIGRNPHIEEDLNHEIISQARAKIQERKVVDIWHNNVERIKWPPGPFPSITAESSLEEKTSSLSLDVDHGTPRKDYAYVHRKGAAPTYNPSTGLPLSTLPLPGSRGTPTIILRPVISEATSWGFKNAPHSPMGPDGVCPGKGAFITQLKIQKPGCAAPAQLRFSIPWRIKWRGCSWRNVGDMR